MSKLAQSKPQYQTYQIFACCDLLCISEKGLNDFTTLCNFTLLTAEIIKWQKSAHMGLNGFHIKCIIGTHCN